MARNQGMPIPPRFLNAPQVAEDLMIYWVAFHELGSTRAIGFSLGPIPWTAMRQWADEYGLSECLREDLYYYLSVLDKEFLEHHAASNKA